MTRVREDAQGLYVKAGGYVSRPGGVTGNAHAMRMDDCGLKAGDEVKARHAFGSGMLTSITLPDGTRTYWHHEGERRDRWSCKQDPDAVYDAKGLRIFPR